ncbi:MAG: BrnA antitoxin family protein [Bauldia sp.]|uniref:BrnA antitoxin family protein n=1 Tax=Bauldia sp. TaxID=2575872 RepID=UPI001D9562F7|nr:BrnA antitoxin family protein [Bauldia sp.]MCB1497931.1 BrnA antitoxin family protein [Bauldia sp.]
MASSRRKPDPYLVDDDTAPLTGDEVRQLRPATEVFEAIGLPAPRPVGRPPVENPKERISLRVDADVLETFRSTGRGWQTRMNTVLCREAKRLRKA